MPRFVKGEYMMLITKEVLLGFNACDVVEFAERFPQGYDISDLWTANRGTKWREILEDPLLKQHVGWAIVAGILPAKVVVDWPEPDLQQANLQWTNLLQANLQKADLRGADLQGANLQGANLHQANLRRAIYNKYTKFPAGFEPDGMILVE